LLIVPALLAIPLLRVYPGSGFMLAYLVLTILLYAIVPGLQGTRQRFQAEFVIIWLQYHALWTLFRRATRARLTS
jgi:hypothetical protein